MQKIISQFVFGYFPYIALLIFIVGHFARYKYDHNLLETLTAKTPRSNIMHFANTMFHCGIIVVFFGHLFGLLTPEYLYTKLITTATKQSLTIIIGTCFGGMCFIGISIILYQRLFVATIRAKSKKSDICLLLIIYIQLCLGLYSILSSTHNLHEQHILEVSTWIQNVITLQANNPHAIVSKPWVLQLHIFLGFILIMIFPFSKLIHIWHAPLKYTLHSSLILAKTYIRLLYKLVFNRTLEKLPVFSLNEVAKHKDMHNGIWVTFKDKVYNITEFINGHPGGDKILQAAGGSIDPFWEIYPIHHSPYIYTLLESCCIGILDEQSQQTLSKTQVLPNLFTNEPKRNLELVARSNKPFNAETPFNQTCKKLYYPK